MLPSMAVPLWDGGIRFRARERPQHDRSVAMDEPRCEGIELHFVPSATELPVLGQLAAGRGNGEIEAVLGISKDALHSTLRRFGERTGLSGRQIVVWAVRHEHCCLGQHM
jgi:hypothetical protein